MANLSKLQVIDSPSSGAGPDLGYLYTQSSTQLYPIGQRECLNNGAVFHYAYAAEAITKRYLCSAATTAAGHKNPYIIGYGTSSAVGLNEIKVIASATTITANMFQGGQLIVSDATSEGESFLIKSHDAAVSGGTCTLKTYNKNVTSITSQSQCTLVPNPFYGVQMYDPTSESYPIGISNIGVTSGYYFWLQTWGPTCGLCDADPPVQGGSICPSSATQGAIAAFCGTTLAAGIYPQIGFGGPVPGADTETIPIFLTICP